MKTKCLALKIFRLRLQYQGINRELDSIEWCG